jgi:hypothetical protein
VLHEQLSAAERSATEAAGGEFIDTTAWTCSDRCQAIAGTFLMYRDSDHMTATFAAALAPQLAASIGAATQ